MNCDSFRNELEDTHAPALLSDFARAHAACCAPCATLWRERLALKALLCSLDAVNPPADFDYQLHQRIERRSYARNPIWSFLPANFSPRASFAVGCASLLLLVTLPFLLTGTFRNETAELPTTKTENLQAASASSINSNPRVEAVNTNAAKIDEQDSETVMTRPHIVAVNGGRAPRKMTNSKVGAARGVVMRRESVALASEERVPIKISSQQIGVTASDSRGGRRELTLDSISFGGQPLVGTAKYTAASSDRQQGIW